MKSGNGLNKSMVPLEPGWVRAALRFFVVRFSPAIARPIYRRETPVHVALRKLVDRRSRVSFPGGVLGPNPYAALKAKEYLDKPAIHETMARGAFAYPDFWASAPKSSHLRQPSNNFDMEKTTETSDVNVVIYTACHIEDLTKSILLKMCVKQRK
nr:hypothetical protein Iba_chr04cCG13850 [Ipomoea batatas]